MAPRIKSLHYKVIPDKTVDYDNAPEITEETDDFILKMDHKKAIFRMKGNLTSVQDARGIVNDFLERWQVLIGLEIQPDDLSFKYETAEFEQFHENGKNRRNLSVFASSSIVVSDHAELHVSRNKFPSRPHRFKLSPDVLTMYQRYKLYRQGKESLTSMAYMCLTVFEASAGNKPTIGKKDNLRKKAANQYNIDYEVLDRLGKLTVKGDELEARKSPKNGIFDALKHEEKQWIERAIKVLIHRAGEWAYDPASSLKKITMTDI